MNTVTWSLKNDTARRAAPAGKEAHWAFWRTAVPVAATGVGPAWPALLTFATGTTAWWLAEPGMHTNGSYRC